MTVNYTLDALGTLDLIRSALGIDLRNDFEIGELDPNSDEAKYCDSLLDLREDEIMSSM